MENMNELIEKSCDICNNRIMVKKSFPKWDSNRGCDRYRYCYQCDNLLCDNCIYRMRGGRIVESDGYFPELVNCLHHYINDEYLEHIQLIKKYVDTRFHNYYELLLRAKIL